MREEISLFVEGIAEIRRLGQRLDGLLRTRKEVPARGRLRAAEMGHRRFFFLSGHVRSLARIKTHEDHLIIAARIKGEHAKRADNALFHLIAEHGAAVINERKHDRLLLEIIAELNVAANLIAKGQVKRQPGVELGLET